VRNRRGNLVQEGKGGRSSIAKSFDATNMLHSVGKRRLQKRKSPSGQPKKKREKKRIRAGVSGQPDDGLI